MRKEKEFLLNRTPGMYFVPIAGSGPSPLLAALAQAAEEARQNGKKPIFFSHPDRADQNPEGEKE